MEETKNNRIIYSCYYAFFINGVIALIFGAIMPYILSDFNIGYDKGGLLLSIQSAGSLIASTLAGMVVIYFGLKKAAVTLTSMTVIGFVSMLFTKNPAFLLISFFLTGLGRGSISNISNTIVNDVSDGDTAKLNLLHTFFAVGAFMTPFFASWSFNRGYSWQFIIGVISILTIILVLNFSSLKIKDEDEVDNKRTEREKASDLKFFKNIDFYLSGGILFFYVGVEYAVNGWIVTYLKDTGLMSTTMAQTILSLLWIVIIFGRLFTAKISKRLDNTNILLASASGTIIFFGIFLTLSNLWGIIFCILGLGFCLAGIYPTTISNVGEVLQGSSLAMGALLGVAGSGGIIMPYITGLVAESRGIGGGMIVISIAVICMFLCTLANKIRKQRRVI